MHKFLLFLFLSFVGTSLLVYIFQTRQYPQWDEHHYLTIAVTTLDDIKEHGITGTFSILENSGHRQPIYPLIIATILLVTGTDHTYKIALGLNALLFCLTMIGIYRIARRWLSKTASLFAVITFGTYGNALFYAHFTYVETAVTAAIVWAIVAIHKTQKFANTKWSLVAGAIVSAATLTRFIAPAFLAGPILAELITSRKPSRVFFKNAGLFLIISIGLPLILYFIPNREPFLEYVRNNQTLGPEWVAQYRDPAMANIFSIRSIMYYFNILQQNTIIPFLAFVFGIMILLWNIPRIVLRASSKYPISMIVHLLFSFLFPYAFLTFITIWKEDRFIVPLYPTMAIISAVFVDSLRRWRMIQTLCITLLVGVGFMNFFGGLFGIGPAGQRGLVDYITPRWVPHPRRIYFTPLVWPPTKEYTNARLAATIIQNDWQNKEQTDIGITFDHEPFINAFSSLLWYEQRTLGTLHLQATEDMEFLDYLFTQQPVRHEERWKLIATIPIPYDKSDALLYRRITQ